MKGEIVPESAVRFVREFDAPVAKVWAFLTDSSLLPEWYGEGTIEPREGGKISLLGGHISGVVTGWRPEKFLGYTWNVFQPGENVSHWPISYVEFTLDGSRLTLIHRPIPQDMQNQTRMGWHVMLDLIAAGLNGDYPKRAAIVPRNAALYGVDLNALKR
ncbi:MAG TPA: SRPBCC domain-containing protein [Rhizomicrobium sp.]|nr:SRPBCC domain-containing protein [Rhizomicrobium sp.]